MAMNNQATQFWQRVDKSASDPNAVMAILRMDEIYCRGAGAFECGRKYMQLGDVNSAIALFSIAVGLANEVENYISGLMPRKQGLPDTAYEHRNMTESEINKIIAGIRKELGQSAISVYEMRANYRNWREEFEFQKTS